MNNFTDGFTSESDLKNLNGPHISSHYILWIACSFLFISFVWAYFALLDEVSTGQGKVIPSTQIQVIQNLEGGIIQQILVREGQIVEKNQVLMIMDDTQFASSFNESVIKAKTLESRIIRLKAESENNPLVFPKEFQEKFPEIVKNETSLYKSRILDFKTKLETLNSQKKQKQSELEELVSRKLKVERSVALVSKELLLTRPLLEEGAVSQVEILRLEREENELQGEVDSTAISINRLEESVTEATSKIKELETSFNTEAINEITQTKSELAILTENKTALEDKVNRTKIRSPSKGTIKKIHVTTIGGVIQPGMDLIEIVPLNDTLLIEAYIKPSDIGFIHPGQIAIVKITAYDFSIYGGLEGTIEHISADTVKNEQDENQYKIHVRTDKTLIDRKGNPLLIIPGMLASVDILTGEKSVLDYLLKPILKAKQNALRER